MEGEGERQWSFATNWEVSGGALDGCITFETPDPSCNDHDADEHDQPVSLKAPTSSDSGPCEIQVRLAQKHEIRQVYVRCTARVYEIYLLSETHGKEYLCTVRCGVAGKEQSPPNDASDENAIHAEVDEITMEPSMDKGKNDRNGTNEDGWVEVKVPSPSSSDASNGVLSRKICGETQISQDFYEATAEISDSNPCIGFTIRLLSLQTKGCVHLEEIYIFAEPVESYATDHPIGGQEKQGQSNLLAMLVPTLLQLSNSGINKIQNRYISNGEGKRPMRSDDDVEETNLLSHNFTSTRSKELQCSMPFEEGNKLEEANMESAKSARSEYGGQDHCKVQGLEFNAKENDHSCNRAESLLGQLFHRLGRIETFCEGIEKNMLRSFSCIDTRLQRLEQQMELLATRSQSPELFHPSTKITAPEFSCNDSEANSCYNDDQNYVTSELSKKDICEKDEFMCDESKLSSARNGVNEECSQVLEYTPKDVTIYESYNPLLPKFVVTAPDFSVVDGDSLNDVVDASAVNDNQCNGSDTLEMSSKGCSRDKPGMSLEEAVASALAGFLISSSAQTPQYGETVVAAVGDCSSDESIKDCGFSSTGIQCSVASELLTSEINTADNVKEIEARPCETIQAASNCTPAAAAVNMVRAGPVWEEEFEDQCLACGMDPSNNQCMQSNEPDSLERKDCKIDDLNQLIATAVGNNIMASPTDFEESYSSPSQDANDESEKLPKLKFDGVVDFEFPILDVEFAREQSLNEESHLLSLLGSRSDATTVVPLEEQVDVTTEWPEEPKTPAINKPLAELDDDSTQSNMEINQVEGLSVCINLESSLI